MTLSPRALGVVICLAVSACVGGPTSEWPPRNGDDGEPVGPPSTGADAGIRPPMDAGTAGSSDGKSPCVNEALDGGSDAGVGDPDDPGNPYDNEPEWPAAGDAGCR